MDWTAKTRVQTALRGGIPDRAPRNYLVNRRGPLDLGLKRHFGLGPDDDEPLRDALGVDIRQLYAPYTGPRLHPERPDRQVDPATGVVTRWAANASGGYWDFCDFPLADADEAAAEAWPLPDPDHFDYAAVAAAAARHRGLALAVGSPGLVDILNKAGMVMGPGEVYMRLADEDPAFLRYTDRRLAVDLEVARRTLEAAGGAADFVWIGEDLGTQQGPLISLESYRKCLRPRTEPFVELARSFGIPTMVHSCGSSWWAFEEFIDMGIAAVDTLQPEAAGMDPKTLKARFGGRLAFHGGVSTAGAVTGDDVDAVRREVRAVMAAYMPGGGYLMSPTHCWQDNAPVANILAVYETAEQCGAYAPGAGG